MRKPLQSLDEIQASEELKEKTFDYVMTHQKKTITRCTKQRLSIVVATLLFLLIPIGIYRNQTSSPSLPVATLSLDINPSLEFSLDEDFRVLSVKTFNDDAEVILNKLDMEGKQVEEAITMLFSQPEYATYLQTGFLEVGVYSKEGSLSDALNQRVTALLAQQLESSNYHCSNIDEETHEAAQEHHVSTGKYRVIETILTYDPSISIEELSKKSMKELYDQLATYDETAVPEGCGSSHTGQGHQYGKDK